MDETDENIVPNQTLVPTAKRLYRKRLIDFRSSLRNHIMTSRFNDSTLDENKRYRREHPGIGCVYCSPDPVSCQIKSESIMFILEMNNDTDKIEGIGLVRNHPVLGRHFVYQNGNYNRYVYTGNRRIDRSEMTAEENRIISVFDTLCFKGNKHMKRGQGLKAFPTDMLYRMSPVVDLVKFIGQMFKDRMTRENQDS